MTEVRTGIPGAAPPRPQRGLRVLVIDPQPESRSLLKAALRSLDTVESVFETSTHMNAQEILDENPVHIIMIDQRLENADVFEVVRKIKSHPVGARARFVLMAPALDMEGRRKSVEAGVLGFLQKPFDIKSLESALRDAQGKVSTNHKDTLDKVRRISFFSEFTDLELIRLLKVCHTRKYAAGEYVFHEGEQGDRLYIVLAGRIDIEKRRDDGVELLTHMSAGDCFGEMAIVDAQPRSADGKAAADSMLIEVSASLINDPNDILSLKLFRRIAMLVTQKLRAYTTR